MSIQLDSTSPFPDQISLESRLKSAKEIVSQFVPPSPLVYSPSLSAMVNGHVWLKLENFLPNGSFKVRGALHSMVNQLHLKVEDLEKIKKNKSSRGVPTHSFCAASAGNHAQGVAFAAQKLGCEAHLFLPKSTPLVKREATQNLGAKVYLEGNVLEESFRAALDYSQKTGATFLHPFNDWNVIFGQATCAMEALEQWKAMAHLHHLNPSSSELPVFLAGVGGGGLLAGACLHWHTLGSQNVVGVESSYFDSAYQSLKYGEIKEISNPGNSSIADGISVKKIGDICYQILKNCNAKIDLVSEDDIAQAILHLLERDRVVAEGAGASGVALLIRNKKWFQDKHVIACVSGGNIDPQLLSRVIIRGLAVTGRVLRVTLKITDRPGQLKNLLETVANLDANVLEVHHDRTYTQVYVGDVEVELVLETKNMEHQYEVLSRFAELGLKPSTIHQSSNS